MEHERPTTTGKGRYQAQSDTMARAALPTVRPTHHILQLQQAAGNQAVGQLLKSGQLQAKLAISQPADKYEQEADRVADQVMRMPATSLQQVPVEKKPQMLQRQTSSGTDAAGGSVPEDFLKSLGPGQPLDASTRAFMEPRFGQHFHHVRVHTGEHAAQLTRSVNARAFTVGRDIVFGGGQYAPGSSAGQRLLAHELTHVVQQGGASMQGLVQRQKAEVKTPAAPAPETSLADLKSRVDALKRILVPLENLPDKPAEGVKKEVKNLKNVLDGISKTLGDYEAAEKAGKKLDAAQVTQILNNAANRVAIVAQNVFDLVALRVKRGDAAGAKALLKDLRAVLKGVETFTKLTNDIRTGADSLLKLVLGEGFDGKEASPQERVQALLDLPESVKKVLEGTEKVVELLLPSIKKLSPAAEKTLGQDLLKRVVNRVKGNDLDGAAKLLRQFRGLAKAGGGVLGLKSAGAEALNNFSKVFLGEDFPDGKKVQPDERLVALFELPGNLKDLAESSSLTAQGLRQLLRKIAPNLAEELGKLGLKLGKRGVAEWIGKLASSPAFIAAQITYEEVAYVAQLYGESLSGLAVWFTREYLGSDPAELKKALRSYDLRSGKPEEATVFINSIAYKFGGATRSEFQKFLGKQDQGFKDLYQKALSAPGGLADGEIVQLAVNLRSVALAFVNEVEQNIAKRPVPEASGPSKEAVTKLLGQPEKKLLGEIYEKAGASNYGVSAVDAYAYFYRDFLKGAPNRLREKFLSYLSLRAYGGTTVRADGSARTFSADASLQLAFRKIQAGATLDRKEAEMFKEALNRVAEDFIKEQKQIVR